MSRGLMHNDGFEGDALVVPDRLLGLDHLGSIVLRKGNGFRDGDAEFEGFCCAPGCVAAQGKGRDKDERYPHN